MGLGNQMDVQHTHRWQNRDLAFFNGFGPSEAAREGRDIVENKICI